MNSYFSKGREPMSSFTHFIGAVLAGVGTVILLIATFLSPIYSPTVLVGTLVFGASMIALYCASTIYHYVHGSDRKLAILRKLDHSMIYVLIAGTYTPIMLIAVGGTNGLVFTLGIWALAVVGIVIKLCWFDAPRWLYTSVYLLMGWAVVFDLPALKALDTLTMWLVAGGGISYTIGAVIYILKRPNIFKSFGFHEVFHVFILLGTLCHFLAVFLFIL